jgi:hypothetical protein
MVVVGPPAIGLCLARRRHVLHVLRSKCVRRGMQSSRRSAATSKLINRGPPPLRSIAQIDLPAVGQRLNRADQPQQRGLVVSHLLRQQSLPIGVNHHTVVTRLPGIHSGPQTLSQPPPCSLSVYQPSRRPRRRVLTQRFQLHLSMKRSSRRGGRAASQSRPSPAHRKEPYPTSLGDPKPNPTKPWGTSSTFMSRIVGL